MTRWEEVEGMISSKIHLDENDFYLLEHDLDYVPGVAFHFVISWIFAPGPKMLERVVKPIFR